MAAFSSFQHQQRPFLLDSSSSASVLLPSSPSPNNGMRAQPDINANSISSFPLFYQSGSLHNLDQSTKDTTDKEANSVVSFAASKFSMDSSSIVTDRYEVAPQLASPMDKKRKSKQGSSENSAPSKDKRSEPRGKKQKKIGDGAQEKKKYKEEKKSGGEGPAGYIHVRARRGQATDSHSLAERVRRERISERMKLLQSLVPGCDKVTGKALMLDEIINYVQSLQIQVEFLSMKLASLNPIFYDFGADLESFMARPHQGLCNLPSPLPSIPECSPTTAHNDHLLENTASSILLQQAQIPNVLPLHGSRQTLWEAQEHRQRIINQSAGFSNTLFSFN